MLEMSRATMTTMVNRIMDTETQGRSREDADRLVREWKTTLEKCGNQMAWESHHDTVQQVVTTVVTDPWPPCEPGSKVFVVAPATSVTTAKLQVTQTLQLDMATADGSESGARWNILLRDRAAGGFVQHKITLSAAQFVDAMKQGENSTRPGKKKRRRAAGEAVVPLGDPDESVVTRITSVNAILKTMRKKAEDSGTTDDPAPDKETAEGKEPPAVKLSKALKALFTSLSEQVSLVCTLTCLELNLEIIETNLGETNLKSEPQRKSERIKRHGAPRLPLAVDSAETTLQPLVTLLTEMQYVQLD